MSATLSAIDSENSIVSSFSASCLQSNFVYSGLFLCLPALSNSLIGVVQGPKEGTNVVCQ
jgi:hypothetical protein